MIPCGLTRVATYRREVRASLERVWENVLDWEHLPWLHGSTFCDIECSEGGRWGWRAWVGFPPPGSGPRIRIELLVERPQERYVTRTLEGPAAGTEIWTSLAPTGDRHTDVEVEFWLPDVDPAQAAALGSSYNRLYRTLWDEDEAMMMRRERELARARAEPGTASLSLGSLGELRARLPLCVDFAGRAFRVVEVDGALVAHSAVCPHWLGPLDDAPVEDGCITCPWHGYRFDVQTGRNADGRPLRLAPAPRVEIDPQTREVRLTRPGAA